MNLLKHLTIIPGLALALTTVATGSVAQAHVLKQNNGISGVLHIPPNDEPHAGEPTKLDINFADKTSGFNLQDCDCKVSITQSGKVVQTVLSEPALTGATLDSSSTVTFPRIGVYEVIAIGTSKSGGFPNFRLDYTVRVVSGVGSATATSSVNNKSNSGATILIIAAGSFAVLAMIAFTAIGQGSRYNAGPESIKTKKPSPKSK